LTGDSSGQFVDLNDRAISSVNMLNEVVIPLSSHVVKME
jgi:hypothetical protein